MAVFAMAKVRARKETGTLYLDFFYRGKRCREQTALPDTPANRKKIEKILERIEFEIKLGTFDYAKFFPGSRMAAKCTAGQAAPSMPASSPAVLAAARTDAALVKSAILPTFKEFAAAADSQ